jgi:hypothetical protein
MGRGIQKLRLHEIKEERSVRRNTSWKNYRKLQRKLHRRQIYRT